MPLHSIIKLPRFKVLIGIALTASFCGASAVAQVPDVPASLGACAVMSDDMARLGCYDGLAGRVNAAAPSVINAPAAINAPEAKEAARKRTFGLAMPSIPKFRGFGSGDQSAVSETEPTSVPASESMGKKTKTKPAKADNSVTFTLKNTLRKANGKMRFEFENGQVWDQIDTGRVSKHKGDEPVTARIKTAAFGSYLMQINNRGRNIRVKRVK